MSRADGTGPTGAGRSAGREIQKGQGSLGRGRGGGLRQGPGGVCICPACGFEMSHEYGQPCFQKKCLICGAIMTRKP